jgi:hypothetical protein
MPNDIEIEDRRKFLISCGRFAAVTPPAMTLLLSTSLTSTAIARSDPSGHGSEPGRSFFDNDPDAPKEKQASENSGSRNDQARKGDGNQASVGGAGGGGGNDGGGAGGGTSATKDSRGGGSGSPGGGGGGSASRYSGGEEDKWRKGSRL